MKRALLLLLVCCACGPKPTLSAIERDVFKPSCAFAACHAGSRPSGGLNLEGSTYAKLVDVDAPDRPGSKLVVAGDPNASWLYQKLSLPTESMPPGAPLEAERLAMIREWILAGAKND